MQLPLLKGILCLLALCQLWTSLGPWLAGSTPKHLPQRASCGETAPCFPYLSSSTSNLFTIERMHEQRERPSLPGFQNMSLTEHSLSRWSSLTYWHLLAVIQALTSLVHWKPCIPALCYRCRSRVCVLQEIIGSQREAPRWLDAAVDVMGTQTSHEMASAGHDQNHITRTRVCAVWEQALCRVCSLSLCSSHGA